MGSGMRRLRKSSVECFARYCLLILLLLRLQNRVSQLTHITKPQENWREQKGKNSLTQTKNLVATWEYRIRFQRFKTKQPRCTQSNNSQHQRRAEAMLCKPTKDVMIQTNLWTTVAEPRLLPCSNPNSLLRGPPLPPSKRIVYARPWQVRCLDSHRTMVDPGQ